MKTFTENQSVTSWNRQKDVSSTSNMCIIYTYIQIQPYRMNMESTNWSCKTQQSQYMKNVTFLTQGRLSNSLLWTWNFVTLSGTPQHLRVLDADFGSTSFWMDYSIFTNRRRFQPICSGDSSVLALQDLLTSTQGLTKFINQESHQKNPLFDT